jgi:hypothetical protein
MSFVPTRRVLLFTALAFGIYGSWALWANVGHGWDVGLRAGLVQGCSSGLVTFSMSTCVELVHGALWRRGFGAGAAVLAALAAVAMSALLHIGLNTVAGTPEVARTVAFPIAAGVAYSAAYAYAQHRRMRSAPAGAAPVAPA